jgi:hypothetical protein
MRNSQNVSCGNDSDAIPSRWLFALDQPPLLRYTSTPTATTAPTTTATATPAFPSRISWQLFFRGNRDLASL